MGLVSLELLDAKKYTPPKIGKVKIHKKWVFFNMAKLTNR